MTKLLSLLVLAVACTAETTSPEPNYVSLVKRQFGDIGSLIGGAFGANLGKMKGEPGGCK